MVAEVSTAPILTPALYPYSYIIRDGILNRLKEAPTFSSVKTFAKNRGKGPVQPENRPFLACYFMDENYGPDGDINAGAPHFRNRVRLGFSVIISSNDNDVAEANLNIAQWAIMMYLTRQDWHRIPIPAPWPPVDIEGIERVSWKTVFGNPGLNNEAAIAELQMEMTVVFRTYFLPVIPDDFLTMHVTVVAGKWPYDPEAGDSFPMVYDIPQNVPPVNGNGNGSAT